MEAITIIPTYSDTEEIEVSDTAMQSIQKGLEDAKNGRLINELEANKIFQNVINQVA